MITTKSAYRGHEVISLRNIRTVPAVTIVEMSSAYTIKETPSGVRCGNHADRCYHANAASVRACYQLSVTLAAEAESEIAAERGYERHLEDRGYDEARAQELHEQRNGAYRDRQGW